MALIIPGVIAEKTPPGEKQVYTLLSNAPKDWVIFHSLDLTPINQNRPAEIDFLVLIPDLGFIVIEVKSHEGIHFDGQRWSPESIEQRGCPFSQAVDAKWAFSRRLSSTGVPLSLIPVHPVVIFTNSAFEFTAEFKFHGKCFFDSRRLSKLTRSGHFYEELRSSLIFSIDNDSRKPLATPVDRRTVEEVKRLCAPIQSVRLTAKETIRAREQEALDKLRLQQKAALNLIFDTLTYDLQNSRVLIKGAAGTGKTWVAMEAARIMADKGCRVGLVSYNKYIGNWMAENVSKDHPRPNLVVGSITSLLMGILDIKAPSNFTSDYWNEEFLDEVEERLTDPSLARNVGFDYLVIDEAQDILANNRLWQIVSQLIKGGLKSGKYSIFGDFDFQVFGNKSDAFSALAKLREEIGVAQFVLRENCRNYQPVGEIATTLAGLGSLVYDSYRRSGGSIDDYDIQYYSSPTEQAELVKRYIDSFKKQGYQHDDIVLLSFNGDSESVATRLDLGVQVRPFWVEGGSGVRYSSVNAFKGLEAKKIILTDVQLDGLEFRRNQLYTGITRSTESVIILCHESARQSVLDYIEQSEAKDNE
jgi:Nuclease-related domain/UvrD-like helicase C-terminal domain/Type III restriction enzyme, res subunit